MSRENIRYLNTSNYVTAIFLI